MALKFALDVAPKLFEGRTLIPLRFVSEAFGANVSWSSETRTVTIESSQIEERDGADRYYDIDTFGVPKLVTHDITQLEKVNMISKFRSGTGHDYSDGYETCRSMKHYYAPYEKYIKNHEIKVYAPVDGVIHSVVDEGYGSNVGLTNKPNTYKIQ